MNRTLTAIILCCFGFAFASYSKDNASLETFDTNSDIYADYWDVSGYIKVLADIPTNGSGSKLELDDLSIFVSGNVNKWLNPFVEAEFFAVPLWQDQGNAKLSDGNFIFERLYNDFKINRNDQIRVGKFLAPVGFWNLIHAAPLVWTINRPASSTYSYSNYITGIEYGHLVDAISGSRFDVYLQLNDEFDPKPLSEHPRRYNKILGGSWTFSDNLDTRSSLDFQYAEVKNTNSKRFTFSFQKVWYFQSWDIDTQLIYTSIKNNNAADFEDENAIIVDDAAFIENGWDGGGYLQARYRLTSKWNVYARNEYFHFAIKQSNITNKNNNNSYILGSRYRIGRWGNINVEYKSGSNRQNINDNSVSISYNAMFR